MLQENGCFFLLMATDFQHVFMLLLLHITKPHKSSTEILQCPGKIDIGLSLVGEDTFTHVRMETTDVWYVKT